ncbi:MAG: TIGR00341 family protein, partial [Armatimonadota bacterium]|nr:TIGR00341 family protein [Armatimonadota bacterium]
MYASIAEMSAPTRSFYVMVAISTIIAGYGLLANSTAVVIGAMLVAPLMGPIFGIALGLCTGDRQLLRQAALSEVLGVALAVAVGFLIGVMPLRMEYGSEIAARTEPTLYDIIVALAAGLAGAYALINPKISPALPGVAMAVALVPPLSTCGLCLAAHRWDWGLGAFLLFFANFLAIELAAALVFTLSGLGGAHDAALMKPTAFLRRFGLSLAVLTAMGFFMTRTLVELISERHLSQTVRQVLDREVQNTAGAQVSQIRLDRRGEAVNVVATVLTPQEFEPAQVAAMEAILRREVDPRVALVVRSLLSRDADRDGPVFLPDAERRRRARAAEQGEFLTTASHALSAALARIPGAQLADLRREQRGNGLVVTAVVRTPAAIDPAQVAELESALQEATRVPARLVVRSILTRDADAQRFLYEPEKTKERPLTG